MNLATTSDVSLDPGQDVSSQHWGVKNGADALTVQGQPKTRGSPLGRSESASEL